MSTTYADVAWTAEDVRALAPSLTEAQADAWLARNEKRIRDRTIELGWEVIETLLFVDNIEVAR